MANYFTLTKIGETEPTAFVDIDEELCDHFEVPIHPKNWLHHWYDVIGLSLATGRTFDEIISETDGQLNEIARYLRDHYISNAWYSR